MNCRALAVLLLVAGCRPSTEGGGVAQPRPRRVLLEVAPDAQPVLDAWTTALGGQAAIDRLGGYHATGIYSRGGLTGTVEVFQSPSGARREIVQLGILREERVKHGIKGWLVDRNREVRALAGFELDDITSSAFIGAWAPLVPWRMAGDVILDGDKLTITPLGNTRRDTLTFDRTTHLPASLMRRDGEKVRTTHFGDWKAVDGVRMAMSLREDNGNPNDAVTIKWTQIKRAELDDKLFERPADRESDATLTGATVTVPIEVVFGGLIFMKVQINGVPLSFVFDTGAEVTVLNKSRLTKLGLTAVGRFATGAGGGDVELSWVKGVTTQVGDATLGASVKDQIVAAVDLDALEVPLRRPLDGILGYDFISRFVFEVDYKNQTMTLHERASYQHRGAGKAQPMLLEESTPYVEGAIEVPGRGFAPGRFVLDTGCLCNVQLFSPFVDRYELLAAFPDAKRAGYSAGAGGETHQVSAFIPSLRIGPVTIDNPSADFSRDTKGATADPETAGLIGSVALGRFVLVLDYKRERFYLDPHPN